MGLPTYRDFGVAVVTASLVLLCVNAGLDQPVPMTNYYTAWLGLFLGLSALFWAWKEKPRPAVDIWDYQYELMHASGQRLPTFPAQINATTLLYYGLVLEEMAEAAATLRMSLHRAHRGASVEDDNSRRERLETALLFTDIQQQLAAWSKHLRKTSSHLDHLVIPLPKNLGVALLDDLSDVAVTLAGLGNSTGLPCAAGYEEVQRSNLSKRNPKTGVIDRDETGKWIKGTSYQPPNLSVVLDQVWDNTPGSGHGQPR